MLYNLYLIVNNIQLIVVWNNFVIVLFFVFVRFVLIAMNSFLLFFFFCLFSGYNYFSWFIFFVILLICCYKSLNFGHFSHKNKIGVNNTHIKIVERPRNTHIPHKQRSIQFKIELTYKQTTKKNQLISSYIARLDPLHHALL
jgi:hypothetical protein